MKQKIILSLVLSAILMAFAWWHFHPQAEVADNAKPEVKIGIIYPMSGDGAVYGEAAKAEAEMFFRDFNNANPCCSYKVIFEDNQLKPSRNAAIAQKLINLDKVDVLVTCLSNFGAVVSPIAEQNKVLHFSVATDPVVAEGKYNFMASSNVEGEVQKLYDTLNQNQIRTLDVVIVNASGPQSMLDHLEKLAQKEDGVKIGQIYHVNENEKDFRLLLGKIKQNNPDYILVLLAMPTIDVFMRQYAESKIAIPVTGIETFTYLHDKTLAEGMWYVDAAAPTQEFLEKYQAQTGSRTTNYAEYLDLILQAVTAGYEGAQTTDREKVADYILNNFNNAETAIGPVQVSPDGIIDGEPVLKMIVNGQIQIMGEE